MITKERAREIAQKECQKQGWPWLEPVYIRWGLFHYTVWGGGRKGGNLHIKIKKKDGTIVSSGMTPR